MPVSYWIASTPETAYPPLEGTVRADVAVVGAGITGITTARLLKQGGATVALVEADGVARGVTGYTTAKLTSGHALVYDDLIGRFGEQEARTYAEANQAAIELIAALVGELGIECDFERTDNYVYAQRAEQRERIEREVDAARRAGLPAELVEETPLPFAVEAAVRLPNQAQFHPRKYLLPLVATIPGDGSHVFERTKIVAVEDTGATPRCRVVSAERAEVVADHVILATHIPFADRGLFFTKVHPSRSYAVAARIATESAPSGMFINTGTPTRSIRSVAGDGSRLILVGGEGHKPGEDDDTRERYGALEAFLRDEFPAAAAVTHRWSTQDYMSVDRVPYVGRLTRRGDRVLVATGFGKWGLTNGTAAARMLADAVLGSENPWASLYDAKRLDVRASARRFVTENASVARHFVGDRLRLGDRRSASELGPGEGAVLRAGGRLVAVSRTDDGRLVALSPLCTHLRCVVAWNRAERSWDCPCHGSRFSSEGKVIQGPAVDDLEPRPLPALLEQP